MGTYSEAVTIAIKGDTGDPKQVSMKILIFLPLKKTNMTCPLGGVPSDCFPKIKHITNSGVIILFFPMKFESYLDDIDFRNDSRTIDIELKQQEPQANTSISD